MIEIVALTLETLGTVLIAYTAIKVHERVRKEKKIDNTVIKEMVLEKTMGFLGIASILISYIMNVILTI